MTRVVRRRAASSARTQKVSLKECQAFKHSRGGCMWRPAAQVRAGCARDENESEQCRGQTRDGYDRQTDSDGCGSIDSTFTNSRTREGQTTRTREGQTRGPDDRFETRTREGQTTTISAISAMQQPSGRQATLDSRRSW